MTALIAHRGRAGEHRENSLGAVRAAIRGGAGVVEVDVRATSDAVLVCAHDRTLARTHEVDRRVGELTWTELHELAPDVPRLDEVLRECGGQTGWFLDCKVSRPRAIDELLRVVEEAGLRWAAGGDLRAGGVPGVGTCVFEHDDAAVVQHVASRTDGACVELVTGGSTGLELALTAPFVCAYAHGVVIPEALATRRMIRLLRTLRLGVYVYTVDDPDRIAQLAADGASGVFSDDVTLRSVRS